MAKIRKLAEGGKVDPPVPPDLQDAQSEGPTLPAQAPGGPTPIPRAPVDREPQPNPFASYLQRRVAEAGRLTQGGFHQPGGIDVAAGGGAGLMNPMAGVVTGPARDWFMQSTGKLGKYLDKIPEKIFVERVPQEVVQDISTLPRSAGAVAGNTASSPGGLSQAEINWLASRGSGAAPGSHTVISLSDVDKEASTPVHEGLHAAYGVKNLIPGIQRMYPAGRFLRQIYDAVTRLHPMAAAQPGVREGVIEGMARNATPGNPYRP